MTYAIYNKNSGKIDRMCTTTPEQMLNQCQDGEDYCECDHDVKTHTHEMKDGKIQEKLKD